MRTDKDLFDLIKESYPLNPSDDFVSTTANVLRQHAKKRKRKSRLKHFALTTSSVVISFLAISSLFLYGEKVLLTDQLNSQGVETPLSTVTDQDPLVYIYQSHNLESFTSETTTNKCKEIFHEEKNVTLIGERLSKSLKEKGINVIHDKTNIMEILKEKNLPFSEAYTVSREPLNHAIQNHKTIKMIFDIHRDSNKRNATTVNIDGQDYSKVAFIVSGSSRNDESNKKFAVLLQTKLEEKYPGLSRGVFVKDNQQNQNTYNQDLSDNSVLLEIGGVENTLEEEYRTADILAEIIHDILQEAKRGD